MHNTVGGEYNSGGITLSDKQLGRLQQDSAGNLLVSPQVSGGGVASANPLPVVTQPVEVLVTPVVSAAAYSVGVSIGGAIPLSGGFIVGATAGSLRDLSVDVGVSTTANITATILRGAVSTASTVADRSSASIAVADAGKVVGVEVLTPLYPPGALATVYRATGLDYIVQSGGFVVLTPSATITLPSTSAVTVGAGIA